LEVIEVIEVKEVNGFRGPSSVFRGREFSF